MTQLMNAWYFQDEYQFGTIPPAGPAEKLLQAILICANGDGEITPPEREWVLGFGASMMLSDEAIERLRNYAADEDIEAVAGSEPLVDQFGRRALCYFAIRAAKADGSLEPGEKETITRMATQAGLSDETIAELFALVEAEGSLKALRRLLLLPEGAPF